MIRWTQQEEDICEGHFSSRFFRNDENSDEFSVYAQCTGWEACAEKCVAAFNSLPESEIYKICEGIIQYLKEHGFGEEIELPASDRVLDILNDCWFISLYVNMRDKEDEISYIVEGEGGWGEAIGFVIKNNQVIYVGDDYFSFGVG